MSQPNLFSRVTAFTATVATTLLAAVAALAFSVASMAAPVPDPVQVTVQGKAAPNLDGEPFALNPALLQQLSQHYSEPVRWQQVLAHVQQVGIQSRWAILTKPAELPALEQLRTSVVNDLHQLGQFWARKGKSGLLRSATELKTQLVNLPLAARQPVSFDYDLVRLTPKLNPLLQGEYQLTLQPRPDYVWAQGVVRLPGKRPFVGGGFAYDYGRRLSLLPGANAQQLWIIQPDGKVTTSPIDAFAPEFMGVAPGATLFVGFNKLPTPYADLNQRIITLFSNRAL